MFRRVKLQMPHIVQLLRKTTVQYDYSKVDYTKAIPDSRKSAILFLDEILGPFLQLVLVSVRPWVWQLNLEADVAVARAGKRIVKF